MSDRPDELFVQRFNAERENEAREISIEDFKSLIDRASNDKISAQQLKARYCYLRRGQEPDDELLKDIKSTMKVNEQLIWTEFRKSVLPICLNPSVEHMLYVKHFKSALTIKEKHMLKRYFIRKELDIKKEFLLRQKYIKTKSKM